MQVNVVLGVMFQLTVRVAPEPATVVEAQFKAPLLHFVLHFGDVDELVNLLILPSSLKQQWL